MKTLREFMADNGRKGGAACAGKNLRKYWDGMTPEQRREASRKATMARLAKHNAAKESKLADVHALAGAVDTVAP